MSHKALATCKGSYTY